MVEFSRTALILEDEPLVVEVFRKVLQNNGFVVLAAETAEAALRWYNDHKLRIALIIADIILPGASSGTDAVLQIRSTRPDVPVLFISGTPPDAWSTEDSQNVAALPMGSYSLLQKPFTVQTLMDAIEELLSRKASLQTV